MNYPGSHDPREWTPEDWREYAERKGSTPADRLALNLRRADEQARFWRCGSCGRRLRALVLNWPGFARVTCRHADCTRDVDVDVLGCGSQSGAVQAVGLAVMRRDALAVRHAAPGDTVRADYRDTGEGR